MTDMTKVLALYLPQYYETDYNNDWWGKGYTEWTACKQAKPLFDGQYQPKIPLGQHYYNLSNKDEILNQVKLANQYGIDGFVIYQYYSCNDSRYGDRKGKHGTMLLNKPTELIRDNPDIDIPFCFCWANHDWRKLWFGQDPKMLWPQLYGDEKDWREYFDYNLTYFKDKRYIKIDNKPVFFIFSVWHFKEIDKFMQCWNRWATENGFDGIYFVKTADAHTTKTADEFDAVYRREPFYTFANGFGKVDFLKRVIRTRFAKYANKVLNKRGKGIISFTCDYDKLWESIVCRNDLDKTIIPGAVADWDNTARKEYNAQILTNVTPEKFGCYLSRLYKSCCDSSVPFLVINAWNEWAEGAYLEPDEKSGYRFLNSIKMAKSI